MFILKAIGRFFARIGRWIRDTAWVQPLLIVGGIFGIIFSIPHITKWVQSWFNNTSNAAESFYDDYALSYKNIESNESRVNDVFEYMIAMENPTSENQAVRTAGEKYFGKKFFLSWYKEGCADCEANYKGFKTLKNNWNKNEFAFEDGKKEDFKFFTIDVAETNSDGDLLFEKYIQKTAIYDNVFTDASELWNPYVQYGHISGYDFLMDKDTVFTAPTTFLVDFTEAPNVDWDYSYGVTEIFCQIKGKDNGSGSYALARTLWDCWNHEGIFSSDPNEHKN